MFSSPESAAVITVNRKAAVVLFHAPTVNVLPEIDGQKPTSRLSKAESRVNAELCKKA